MKNKYAGWSVPELEELYRYVRMKHELQGKKDRVRQLKQGHSDLEGSEFIKRLEHEVEIEAETQIIKHSIPLLREEINKLDRCPIC